MKIHEMFGRQAEKMQEMQEGLEVTLQLLRDIRDNKIQPSQLIVTDNGWEIQEAPDGNQESGERTDSNTAESYRPVLHSGNALPGPALVSGGQVDGGRPD